MGERGFIHQLIILVVVIGVIIYAVKSPFLKGIFLQYQSTPPVASSSAQINPDNQKVSDLEKKIDNLQNQVDDLKKPAPSSTPRPVSSPTPVVAQAPMFISLGNSDPFGDQGWINLGSLSIQLDPSDYPNYSSVQLEAGLRVNSEGVGSVRLINSTTNQPIDSSIVSTTNTSFVTLTSAGFKLSPGRNTYQVQGMSSLGDNIFTQNIRIRINF